MVFGLGFEQTESHVGMESDPGMRIGIEPTREAWGAAACVLPTWTMKDIGEREQISWWMTWFIAFVNLPIRKPIMKMGEKITGLYK